MALSFSQQVTAWSKKTNSTFDNSVKAIRVQIVKGVLGRSPVDDSGLVQSWLASINSPSSDVADVPKGAKDTSAKARAIEAAIKVAENSLDKVFWLTNNKPYVRVAEYGLWPSGYSKKSPYGMVRITLQEFKTGMEALLKNV